MCPSMKAYALAHKGKAMADIDHNTEDPPTPPPSVYNNATVHPRLTAYSDMAREVHGAEFDPINQPIDGVCAMRARGGKKHGWYMIVDCALQEADIPSPCDSTTKHER
jgi:hypothetical protein